MTDTKEYDYIFYIFTCFDPNISDSYVGSTRAFRERKRLHKSNCNLETSKKHNLKIYQTIRANGGWNSWEMRPIDTKFCTKLEAHMHETKLMEERQSTLNSYKAYTSEEQREEQKKEYNKAYYEQNKEHIKEYREQNKDKLRESDKKRYEQNKDDISAKKKEYYEQNKDAICAKMKEYREQNKDAINAKRREARALKKLQNSL